MSSDEEEDEQGIHDPSKYVCQEIPPQSLTDRDLAPDSIEEQIDQVKDQCTFEDNKLTTCDLKCDRPDEGKSNLNRETPESTFEQNDGRSEIVTENVLTKDEVMSEDDNDELIVDENIMTQMIVIQPLEMTSNVREELSTGGGNLLEKCAQPSHEVCLIF